MNPLVPKLALKIKETFEEEITIEGQGRIKKNAIFQVLRSLRYELAKDLGGPVYCRYPGYTDDDKADCSDPGPFKVMEYLIDFSISRHKIPEAICDDRAVPPMQTGRFELLLAAESELGGDADVCRDLLKLLIVRSHIRCMLFMKRRSIARWTEFKLRIIRTMKNHASFDEGKDDWLFVELEKANGRCSCVVYTLGDGYSDLVEV